MTAGQIQYVEISTYKYKLARPYEYDLPFPPGGPHREIQDILAVTPNGHLTIHADYAWDGPSGPTRDTPAFMRGSLIHDALYQMIRGGLLAPADVWRMRADVILRDVCREDGMSWFRSRYIYAAVRMFGRRAAEPREEPQTKILVAP